MTAVAVKSTLTPILQRRVSPGFQRRVSPGFRDDQGAHRAGLTQEQLAARLKTKQAVIARLESGRVKPSTRTLERIAQATGHKLRISFEPVPTR
jgi:DNA-binding XRE family transcriptional regulator